MPNGDPRDGFFYPILTLIMDSSRTYDALIGYMILIVLLSWTFVKGARSVQNTINTFQIHVASINGHFPLTGQRQPTISSKL